MECPYCRKEMKRGRIDSRNTLYWTEGNEIGAVNAGSVQLSQPSLLVSSANAYCCADCRTVIVPVPEIEDPLDKLGRKWKAMAERGAEARGRRAAQREEEKNRKKREQRKNKDPWEID